MEELWQQGQASAVYDDNVYNWPDVSTTGLSTDAGALVFGALASQQDASVAAQRSGLFFIVSLSRPRRTVSKG